MVLDCHILWYKIVMLVKIAPGIPVCIIGDHFSIGDPNRSTLILHLKYKYHLAMEDGTLRLLFLKLVYWFIQENWRPELY